MLDYFSLIFSFEIVVNSWCKKQDREVLRTVYPVSPKGNIVKIYSTKSQPEYRQ